MPCPHCGKEIEKGLLTCPLCGGEINSSLEDCLERAIELINKEKLKEAMDFLQEVITRYPQSASAHSLLASLYEEAKDLPSAIHHYRRAIKLDPDSTAEKRKLELLMGEKYSTTRLPLLPSALALLGVLFIVLIISSFPPRKPPGVENLQINQGVYPNYYNQWQMPYYYFPNTTNLSQSENITSPTPSPAPSPRASSATPRSPTSQATPSSPFLNLPSELPPSEPFPLANILIQPTTPPTPPIEKRGKISIEIKKVPPSFENLYAQGLQKLKEKDFSQSERLLKQALAMAPPERKGEVYLSLALSLKEQGKWSEARENFALAEQALANRNDPYSQQLLQQAKEGKDFCEERM